MYRVGAGVGGGAAGLAATGFTSLIYAELAMVIIALGLILLRVARIGRKR